MLELSFNHWCGKHKVALDGGFAVAVSGGPDSMALSTMMAQWAQESKADIHFLTVDHGLRESAKEEAQMVAEWVAAQKLENLTHEILTWSGEKPDTAVMEAARGARYDLMAAYCKAHNIQNLLVAHHQDDQAETFLIRLSKGSGLDGLSAMQSVRKHNDDLKILRPLLEYSKQDLIEYCQAHETPFVQDPSNENEEYMRPRLRKSMEVLEGEGLTSKRLSMTAKRMTRARQALEDITNSAFQACLIEKTAERSIFNFSTLQGCPEEIALRVIQKSVETMRDGADYNVRMERLEDLFDSLWFAPQEFKPRTLGGCKFSIKKETQLMLIIEKEKSS